MEEMNEVRAQLMTVKDRSIDALAKITEERRRIEEHLTIAMSTVQYAEDEVKKLQGDVDLKLASVMSILHKYSDNLPSEFAYASHVSQKKNEHCNPQLPALLHEESPMPITSKNAQIQEVTHNVINRSIPPEGFVLGESIFILKIRNGDVTEEIWIQPCHSFNNEFVQNMGTACYKSPKTLDSSFQVGEPTFSFSLK